MKHYPKAIVIQAGNRDYYQLPLALLEVGLLQDLVTDMYWPADRLWFKRLFGATPTKKIISSRFCAELGSRSVRISKIAFCAAALGQVVGDGRVNRFKDKALSSTARRESRSKGLEAVFSYSHYASRVFSPGARRIPYRFLFQFHPHPRSVRRILIEEAELMPKARASLLREHEFRLTRAEFDELADEPSLANGWVAASSYTARTLGENGVPLDRIHVVPYGVENHLYEKRVRQPSSSDLFTVIFVGTLSQRKGLSYLLDAVRLLKTRKMRVVLCGRGFIDKELISNYDDLNLQIKPNLSNASLIRELHRSDLFVLPSLVEGFAHVILEAMSCGLPVVASSHTCAPDVLEEGVQGFTVPIRDAQSIAAKLSWGIEHRSDLAIMGEAAAVRAQHFTWERFRRGIQLAYRSMVDALR